MTILYPIKIEVLSATDPIAIGFPNAQGRQTKIPSSGADYAEKKKLNKTIIFFAKFSEPSRLCVKIKTGFKMEELCATEFPISKGHQTKYSIDR